MRKILKIIAIILVILALLLLLQALVTYMGGPNALSLFFGSGSWLGQLTIQGVLSLALVGLVIAAVISPKGFKKGMDRVTSAVSTTANSIMKMATKTVTAIGKGFFKGIGSLFNVLPFVAVAGVIYYFWPSDEEKSARARAKLDALKAEAEMNEILNNQSAKAEAEHAN